ncbi:MAG: prenyltransferase [Acidobacteria bacterium]|nr:prenyltransferase [Acidobacteriota bacterium]
MRFTPVLGGVPGILSDDEVARSGAYLAELQLPSGLVPWYVGGHADPWNHVECAMALTITGHRAAALAAYEWLRRHQLGDGSWFNYYVGERVEDARLDTNVCAYVAAGVYHYLRASGDVDGVAHLWPMVERAIDFVVRFQRADGSISWSLDTQGRVETYALLTGSSSIFHSLRCAVALAERLDHHRPAWELAAARLGHALAHHPEAFAPKDEFAMDWYYPVLAGAIVGERARTRLQERWAHYVMDGFGVRCVSSNDWVTAAETAEAALSLAAVGWDAAALDLLAQTSRHRQGDGSYVTGIVYPQRVTFPSAETSSYTAAAVLLAVDALTDATPAAGLFRHGALANALDWPESRCALVAL